MLLFLCKCLSAISYLTKKKKKLFSLHVSIIKILGIEWYVKRDEKPAFFPVKPVFLYWISPSADFSSPLRESQNVWVGRDL